MTYSVLIPHRDRNEYLALCIWSLRKSAARCGATWEAIVVDNDSGALPQHLPPVRVIGDQSTMPVFNKPRLQNIAIDAATHGVLVFLDADVIVGPAFFESIACDICDCDRLAFRVYDAPRDAIQNLRDGDRDRVFETYRAAAREGKLATRWEAYGTPDTNKQSGGVPLGNSQFAIRVDSLGNVRPNEMYVGAGFEDLEFNRAIQRAHGDSFAGKIVTDAESCLYHLPHSKRKSDWRAERYSMANRERFINS